MVISVFVLCLFLLCLLRANAVDIDGRVVVRSPQCFKIALNGLYRTVLSREDGFFTFTNVPSGTNYIFPSFKVRVHAENSTVFAAEYKFSGAKRMDVAYPIIIQPVATVDYFQQKPPFSILGMITANPMILMMALSFGAVIFLPKLMQGMDPEQMSELQKEMSAQGDPMQNLQKMMGLAPKDEE